MGKREEVDRSNDSMLTLMTKDVTCLMAFGIKNDGSKAKTESDSGKNCVVVSGSAGIFENYLNFTHFENVREFDCNDEKMKAAEGISGTGRVKSYLVSGLIVVLLWFLLTLMCTEIVLLVGYACAWGLLEYFVSSVISTRIIKWTLDGFSNEMGKYFFTTPTIHDTSGSWLLMLRQTCDEEASFGLTALEIPNVKFSHVVAKIEISVTVGGQDILPGMNDIKFVHKFRCEGDSGYSAPMRISVEQLKNHDLEIKCRIRFVSTIMGSTFDFNQIIKSVSEYMKYPSPRFAARVSENGVILPEKKFQSKMPAGPLRTMLTGAELEGDSQSFTKHPETKVFLWKIPNISYHLKNLEYWELFSPKFLVNSHGFCSMWRLQLIEIQGVFRVHTQLRSLPRGISQIKMRHLLELIDNLGESIVPERGSTIKYPEYLQVKNTHRLSLYRREAILERFVDKNGTLNLRISLQCEPNDIVQIAGDHYN